MRNLQWEEGIRSSLFLHFSIHLLPYVVMQVSSPFQGLSSSYLHWDPGVVPSGPWVILSLAISTLLPKSNYYPDF